MFSKKKKSRGGGCQAMIKLYYCHEGDWVLIMVDYVGGGEGEGVKIAKILIT